MLYTIQTNGDSPIMEHLMEWEMWSTYTKKKKWELPYQSKAEKIVEIVWSKGRFSYLFFQLLPNRFFRFSLFLNPYVVFGTILYYW